MRLREARHRRKVLGKGVVRTFATGRHHISATPGASQTFGKALFHRLGSPVARIRHGVDVAADVQAYRYAHVVQLPSW